MTRRRRSSSSSLPPSIYLPRVSVQDLFDAPAAQEEVEALFEGLDETVGDVSSQEVLASSESHGDVAQALPQGGWHGLGERTLGVHGFLRERRRTRAGGGGEEECEREDEGIRSTPEEERKRESDHSVRERGSPGVRVRVRVGLGLCTAVVSSVLSSQSSCTYNLL